MWVAELCKLIDKQDTPAGPRKARPAAGAQQAPRTRHLGRAEEPQDLPGPSRAPGPELLALTECLRERQRWEGFLLGSELGLPEQMCQLVSKGFVKKGIQIHNLI